MFTSPITVLQLCCWAPVIGHAVRPVRRWRVKGEKPYHRYMHLHVPSNKTQGVNLLSRNGNSQTGERMTQKRPRDGWILAHSMHA